jgi:hypothetical protein
MDVMGNSLQNPASAGFSFFRSPIFHITDGAVHLTHRIEAGRGLHRCYRNAQSASLAARYT